MRLPEYQGKELFSRYSIPVPRSRLAHDTTEAAEAADQLGLPVVIKAQVLSGGRGKAGGVAIAHTAGEVQSEASRIQTLLIGGERTRALLVEEACDHIAELYLSVSLDRGRREFVALASSRGGIDVESASRTGMAEVPVPLEGLTQPVAATLSRTLGLSGVTAAEFSSLLLKLERLSREEECELAEINPVGVRSDGQLVALDSKVVLDDNALFRHPEFSAQAAEDPLEGEAARSGFAFVRLCGDIAVVGNGAGLVLSTMDLLADAGGTAACFLDLGGGAQRERVEAALGLVRRLPEARAVLLNIFGGITRTTDVAEGLKQAVSEGSPVPVFARISGAEEEQAREVLVGSSVSLFGTAQEAVLAAMGAVTG